MAAVAQKPVATLSLDLDNLWAYLRTHGDLGWRQYPSFLGRAVPRFLDVSDGQSVRVTVFVVGRDACLTQHGDLFEAIVAGGHEIGNHSHNHEVDLHLASAWTLADEFERAESAIERATGKHPVGFRGPSFRLSRAILETLVRRGYHYDASTLPTFVGPLARAYHLAISQLDETEKARQQALFGNVRDGLRPLKSYRWDLDEGALIEIPITTMPLARVPLHMTYINFLADRVPGLAEMYLRIGLGLCKMRGISPSLLLHATDFIGSDDQDCPTFLPGMKRTAGDKIALLQRVIAAIRKNFDVLTLREYVSRLGAKADLPLIYPKFAG